MSSRSTAGVVGSAVIGIIALALGIWVLATGSLVGLGWVALAVVWFILALRAWRKSVTSASDHAH